MQYVAPQVDYNPLLTIEDEGWWLVFVAVLLALGATVVLGAAVWCMANGKGSFWAELNGRMAFKFTLSVNSCI